MENMESAARRLVSFHTRNDEGIVAIYEISGAVEQIRLLEVNENTPSAGIMPVTLGPDSEIPFQSTILEVTPDE